MHSSTEKYRLKQKHCQTLWSSSSFCVSVFVCLFNVNIALYTHENTLKWQWYIQDNLSQCGIHQTINWNSNPNWSINKVHLKRIRKPYSLCGVSFSYVSNDASHVLALGVERPSADATLFFAKWVYARLPGWSNDLKWKQMLLKKCSTYYFDIYPVPSHRKKAIVYHTTIEYSVYACFQ